MSKRRQRFRLFILLKNLDKTPVFRNFFFCAVIATAASVSSFAQTQFGLADTSGQGQKPDDNRQGISQTAAPTSGASTSAPSSTEPANGSSKSNASESETGAVPASNETPQSPKIVYKLTQPNDIGIEVRYGYIWQGQSYPTSPTAEAPDVNGIKASPLMNIGGVGVRIGLGTQLRLEPGLEFTYDDYVYKANIGRAFPTQNMTGSSVGPVATVLNFLVSVPLIFEFPLSEQVVWDVGPGLAFYPHLLGGAIDNSQGTEIITEYLNQDLRWFYPMVSTGFQFGIANWVSAGVKLRAFIPIWHIWDREDLPFWDNLLLDLQFDFILHI